MSSVDFATVNFPSVESCPSSFNNEQHQYTFEGVQKVDFKTSMDAAELEINNNIFVKTLHLKVECTKEHLPNLLNLEGCKILECLAAEEKLLKAFDSGLLKIYFGIKLNSCPRKLEENSAFVTTTKDANDNCNFEGQIGFWGVSVPKGEQETEIRAILAARNFKVTTLAGQNGVFQNHILFPFLSERCRTRRRAIATPSLANETAQPLIPEIGSGARFNSDSETVNLFLGDVDGPLRSAGNLFLRGLILPRKLKICLLFGVVLVTAILLAVFAASYYQKGEEKIPVEIIEGNGNVFVVKINLLDTFQDLKEVVEKERGEGYEAQRLVFTLVNGVRLKRTQLVLPFVTQEIYLTRKTEKGNV